MGKRREILDESKIEKYMKMGYGSSEGKEYKPWIEWEVPRDLDVVVLTIPI